MKTEALTKLFKNKRMLYIGVALLAGIALLALNLGGNTKAEPKVDKNSLYVSEAEAALEALGHKVCGVKCKAHVRLERGYTYTYASDQSVRTSYNAAGTVAEKATALNNRTVNRGGGPALVVVKEPPPTVAGVAMVCKNASASDISALKAMIAALYGLDGNAIFVTN